MRAKTGLYIKLSCTGSSIDHTSVRVRELETPRPYIVGIRGQMGHFGMGLKLLGVYPGASR